MIIGLGKDITPSIAERNKSINKTLWIPASDATIKCNVPTLGHTTGDLGTSGSSSSYSYPKSFEEGSIGLVGNGHAGSGRYDPEAEGFRSCCIYFTPKLRFVGIQPNTEQRVDLLRTSGELLEEAMAR